MLKITDLSVAVEDKEIIHDVNLTINNGETHVLFGPNGAGKSTLLMAIMGFPKYKVTKGSISFKGKDITNLSVDERARMGIGLRNRIECWVLSIGSLVRGGSVRC